MDIQSSSIDLGLNVIVETFPISCAAPHLLALLSEVSLLLQTLFVLHRRHKVLLAMRGWT